MARPDQILASEHQWLRRLARRMARTPGAADDLVQDTCVTVLDKPAPSGEMRPWLRAIMRNLAWGEVRGGVRRGEREHRYQRMAPPAVEPDPLLAYGVDRERLQGCVERLPEPFRSTVVQRFVDGLSCAEIARAEGVPAGTVRWRQSRALELLRAELDRPAPRRSHLLWWPALGLESAITAARRVVRTPVAGGAALALVAALLVLMVVSGGDAATAKRGRAAPTAPAAEGTVFAVLPDGDPRISLVPVEGLGPLLRRRGAAAEDPSVGRNGTSPSGDPGVGLGPAELQALRGAYERALYDCHVEGGFLRCVRASVDPRGAETATCVILERSLVALARARRGDAALDRSLPLAFLDAAGLANRALVASLGCAIAPALEDEAIDHGSRGGGARLQPSCTSEEGAAGRPCTTCTDASGLTTTACAPVDCETTAGPDGQPCTTCTDASGLTTTECGGDKPVACDSEVRAYGLLCSSCPAGSGAATECLVAACAEGEGGCLECTDGRGRTGRDCTSALEGLSTASTTWVSPDSLRATTAMWGDPDGAGSAVHHAGTSTCTADHCLDCRFPDGSGLGSCPYDGDLDENLWHGRPSDLPAPGHCVTAQRAAAIKCTTCTREDLSASTMCRFPPAVSCAQSTPGCVTCALVGGGTASSCDGSVR